MVDPVRIENPKVNSKHPIFEISGVRYYYRNDCGYYKARYYRAKEADANIYLHRQVWIENHGEIPPGHTIHHKDHDKAHNALSNLECLTLSDHVKLHMAQPESKARVTKSLKFAREALAHKCATDPEWKERRAKKVAATRLKRHGY